MQGYALFKRHILEIQKAADIIITRGQQTKSVWPELIMTNEGEEGFKLRFSEPAIIWNAPLRGSSSKSFAKRAIVMDGSFYFKEEAFDKGSASLEVYSVANMGGQCTLKLLEAMHFDIEPNANQSPFHPMFHVQFGKNNHLNLGALETKIVRLAKVQSGRIVIDRDINMPTRDVRIPTPQMDYLSMLVMVVADYFCGSNSPNEVTLGFKKLLQTVKDPKNFARMGRQSRQLEGRWAPQAGDAPFSAAHWYQESCS
jgi:hypothetical protein